MQGTAYSPGTNTDQFACLIDVSATSPAQLISYPLFVPARPGEEFQGQHGKHDDDDTEPDVRHDFHACEEVQDTVQSNLDHTGFGHVGLGHERYGADDIRANFHRVLAYDLTSLDRRHHILW